MIQTRSDDEFHYDLLKTCLGNTNLDEEKIGKYISLVREEIEKHREIDRIIKEESENKSSADDPVI